MRKAIVGCVLLLCLISTIKAQASTETSKKRQMFLVSSAVYWGGVAADITSSHKRIELNPILAQADQSNSPGRIIALAAVPYVLSLWLDRKHHSKAANVLRFIGGSVHGTVAVRNFSW